MQPAITPKRRCRCRSFSTRRCPGWCRKGCIIGGCEPGARGAHAYSADATGQSRPVSDVVVASASEGGADEAGAGRKTVPVDHDGSHATARTRHRRPFARCQERSLSKIAIAFTEGTSPQRTLAERDARPGPSTPLSHVARRARSPGRASLQRACKVHFTGRVPGRGCDERSRCRRAHETGTKGRRWH